MVGGSQSQQGLAGLGVIPVEVENDLNQEGAMASTSANSSVNSDNQVPAVGSMSPEIFDWGNSSEAPVPEAETPGRYPIPNPQQNEFMMPPPPRPTMAIRMPEVLINRNPTQSLEERNLTEELEELKKELRKKNVALWKNNEVLKKYQEDKASLKTKLRRVEGDYYDEKNGRKRLREDLEKARARLRELDEEVQRRMAMESNLATVAFSLDKLQSSVKYVVGPGASLSNDVSELCWQLERKMNERSVSYNVIQGKYLKAQEELLQYQRMYGDRSQQMHDARIQAQVLPNQALMPIRTEPLPPSNSLSLSMAQVPRGPPPPPPEDSDWEYDPREAAAIPAIRSSTETPRVSVRPNCAKENEQDFAERDPGAASGSGLRQQHHGNFQGRSRTQSSSSSTSSAMSCGEPTPGPAPKLELPKQLVEPRHFRCNYCNGEFEDKKELFSHQKLVHKKGPHAPRVKRELVAARVPKVPRVRTPAPAHAEAGKMFTLDQPNVRRFACKCGKHFASRPILKAHIKRKSEGNTFKPSPKSKTELVVQEIEGRQKGLQASETRDRPPETVEVEEQPPDTRDRPPGNSSRPSYLLEHCYARSPPHGFAARSITYQVSGGSSSAAGSSTSGIGSAKQGG